MSLKTNLIPVYDANNNYIKKVYSRYAVQRVMQGKAKWIANHSAIKIISILPHTHAITQVFLNIGDRFDIKTAMLELEKIFRHKPFAQKKAAGALGGASRSGFIKLMPNGMWQRIR